MIGREAGPDARLTLRLNLCSGIARTCSLVLLLSGAVWPASAAPGLQPPATGSMFDGNNMAPPRLEAAVPPPAQIRQSPDGAGQPGGSPPNNGAATGASAGGSSGGDVSRAGGGN
jgi:hypothetical protein